MPIATPTMPISVIGVSKARVLPSVAWSPAVARKTPPL
jgi:hypothetical protein